jgi:hypothetical protein
MQRQFWVCFWPVLGFAVAAPTKAFALLTLSTIPKSQQTPVLRAGRCLAAGMQTVWAGACCRLVCFTGWFWGLYRGSESGCHGVGLSVRSCRFGWRSCGRAVLALVQKGDDCHLARLNADACLRSANKNQHSTSPIPYHLHKPLLACITGFLAYFTVKHFKKPAIHNEINGLGTILQHKTH